MASKPSIIITQVEGFKFLIDFGEAFPALVSDEPEPIGREAGPSPEQLMIAGVSNCLCASLAFALGKFRQESGGVSAKASAQVARNAEQRLRIVGIDVEISLGAEAAQMPRIEQVLAQFERFCTVSESVKMGIPVAVSVTDSRGERLK
ncbi:OsmC family protein [Methylobacterium sp. C25]|uniref:OsmC family protein n=1 Tax=Methylobacterium sp. C25 TaxID=2721622 RepID=UPI001F2FA7D5|nr:OsmC family protein [Methylobacterium sp. C25]MCE4224582.1 OsmC family protein [Methylobacterium sp. C25]